jgi:outer membrane protein assembly factor BamB
MLLAGEDVLEAWERGAIGVDRRWSMPLDPSLALLRLDSGGALVSVGDGDLRRLARIDARTGETLWETRAFSAGFDQNTRPAANETVAIPSGPIRPRGEILVALRNDSATLIDRSGRAVGYDVAEGRELWSASLPIDNVYDAAEAGGLIVIVGTRDARDVNARAEPEPAGIIVDAATGRVIAPMDFAGAAPKWVRETTDEIAIVGTERGVVAFNLVDGSRRWFVGETAAQRATEAWSFPGRLILLDEGNRLWQLETETGELSRGPLDTRSRLQASAEGLSVATAGDHAVFALPRGLVMYDRRGELVGLDQRDGLTSLGPHAFADDRAIVLDPHGFEPRVYEARVLELDTGRLIQAQRIELPARPDAVDLIDGRILISAGTGTIVLDAPPEGDLDP